MDHLVQRRDSACRGALLASLDASPGLPPGKLLRALADLEVPRWAVPRLREVARYGAPGLRSRVVSCLGWAEGGSGVPALLELGADSPGDALEGPHLMALQRQWAGEGAPPRDGDPAAYLRARERALRGEGVGNRGPHLAELLGRGERAAVEAKLVHFGLSCVGVEARGALRALWRDPEGRAGRGERRSQLLACRLLREGGPHWPREDHSAASALLVAVPEGDRVSVASSLAHLVGDEARAGWRRDLLGRDLAQIRRAVEGLGEIGEAGDASRLLLMAGREESAYSALAWEALGKLRGRRGGALDELPPGGLVEAARRGAGAWCPGIRGAVARACLWIPDSGEILAALQGDPSPWVRSLALVSALRHSGLPGMGPPSRA